MMHLKQLKMKWLLVLVFVEIIAIALGAEKEKAGPVTCGAVIKLIHQDTGNHLHSHAIAWGSGSGQQSVTTTGSQKDPGSMWLVKEANGITCEIGTPIKCDDKFRLEHVTTHKNLHSHLYKAPLSGNQEVSCFGDGGEGDTGDVWKLICETNEKYWQRGALVSFQHVDTAKYLFTGASASFNVENCGSMCPIMGQTEVSASSKRETKTKWRTGQGVYYPPKLDTIKFEGEL